MPYKIQRPNQYQFFTVGWAQPIQLVNLCISSLGQLYQTQAARDAVRQQFTNSLSAVVQEDLRFPETGFRVFALSAELKPLWEALMEAFDTKNRIIETEEETRPSTTEVVSATRRVDDSTVAIRSELANLLKALQDGAGYYNRERFEEQMAWTQPAATTSRTT